MPAAVSTVACSGAPPAGFFLECAGHSADTRRLMSDSVSFQSGLDKSVSGLKTLVQTHLKFSLARDAQTASKRDWWLATSKAVQSVIIERMIATQGVHHRRNVKRVYYLSLEFQIGRASCRERVSVLV